MSSDRELNILPFESAGLASARRVDPHEVIYFSTSLTKQERRHAYHRKCIASRNSSQFKCDPPAVESRSINLFSSGFTDCESASSDSDFIDTFFVTFFIEGEVTDFNYSIDSVAATYSNSNCNAATDIASISTSLKVGVTNAALPRTTSTSI